MKLKSLGITSLMLTLSLPVAFAGSDHIACSHFINGAPATEVMGIQFKNSSQYQQPFDIKKDGKIEPFKGVKSYTYDKENRQEIIEYEMPTWPAAAAPGSKPDLSRIKPSMRTIKSIVHRDKNDNIIKITQDNNISQKELDEHNKLMKEWYEYTYSDDYKKQMEEVQQSWGLKEWQAPIMVPVKGDIHLSHVGGKCRVDRHTLTHLMEGKINGYKHDTISFDTKLCKDLGEILERHKKKLERCYSNNAGEELAKIARDFAEKNHSENPSTVFPGAGGFGPGMGTYPGMGMGYPGPGMYGGFSGGGMGGGFIGPYSLENSIMSLGLNMKGGQPPLVTAHNIYQSCKFSGLEKFTGDEFWPKEDLEMKAPPHGDDSSGTGR